MRKFVTRRQIVWSPKYNTKDLGSFAKSLEKLGKLEALRQHINENRPSGIAELLELPSSAFGLWERNYQHFGNNRMSEKVKFLRTRFIELATTGFTVNDGNGERTARILNHGVCSGLILLHFITYFYAMHLGLKSVQADGTWETREEAELVETYMIINGARRATGWFWWAALVWATAATAFHDLFEQLGTKEKLSLQDDPLSYLGILVDELQVWDRFNVFDGVLQRKSSQTDDPIQSSELFIECRSRDAPISFSVPRGHFERLRGKLDARLNGWENIISLAEHS
jgi:hypothetical protein